MTPEELRSSILQYAMQGKLVEQRAEEGTSSELLSTIEPPDNIDGQRVKQKKITAITDSDIKFDIPGTWEWVKLGTLCTIARGGSPRPIKEYLTDAADGVNWIKIGDTDKNAKYIESTAEKIKPSGVRKSRMIRAGDFLLTNSMSFGRPYISRIDGCIHDGWLVISQNSEVFDQDFLYYLLSSSYAYVQFVGKVSGAVVKNLNSDKVANSVFPLPPLFEQKRIVAKIEEFLPYIERYAKAWSKLEEFNASFPMDMQKSLLQYAMQGKLVEQRAEEGTGEELYRQIQAEKRTLVREGKIKREKALPEITEDEVPFDIPESWKWVRLIDVVSKTIKRGQSPAYTSRSETLVFAQKCNTKKGVINLELARFLDEKKLSKYPDDEFMQNNDIVINSTGRGTLGRVGMYKLSDNPRGLRLVPDSHVTVIRMSAYVYTEYAYFCLKSFQPYLEKLGTGSTNQTELSASTVKSLLFPLPPFAEQKRIVAKLEELLPLCERLKQAPGQVYR